MPIQHIKTSIVEDGTNSDLIRPSDWNSQHAYTLQDAVSIGGNVVGDNSDIISNGTLLLAGGNNITLSRDANSVTISAFNQTDQTLGINVGNNSYNNNYATVDARYLTINGYGNISVGLESNGNMLFSGPSVMSRFINEPAITNAGDAQGNSLVSIFPFSFQNHLNASNARLGISIGANTTNNNSTAYVDLSATIVLYTRNDSYRLF